MLVALREKSKIIAWVIVVLFCGTLFTGLAITGFYGRLRNTSTAQQNDPNQLAMIGSLPINRKKYSEILYFNFSQLEQQLNGQKIRPELAEIIQGNAFDQALQYTLLTQEAKDRGMEVSGAELDMALGNVYRQYNVRGEAALKALLEKSHYPYDQFIDNLKDDILVQKVSADIAKTATVNVDDVVDKYSEVHVAHVLIGVGPESPSENELKAKADAVYQKIKAGLPFEEAVKHYSDDSQTRSKGGDLGWLGLGKTVATFETALYETPEGGLSKPFRTPFGYHIIRVLGKRGIPRPNPFDFAKEQEALLRYKQSQLVQAFIQDKLTHNKLVINDPSIRAFRAKTQGDTATAIAAYQTLASRDPASPLPHYFLAKVYVLMGESTQAQQELEKGIIKGEMNPGLDFSELHMLQAELLVKQGDRSKASAAYDKAIELSKTNAIFLNQMATYFAEKKDSAHAEKVKWLLAILSSAKPSPGPTPNALKN